MNRQPIPAIVRMQIVVLRQQGLSFREVGEQVGRNHSDVVRTWNRFLATGNVEDRRRIGRPRATIQAEDRYLLILARRNREANATELRRSLLQATGTSVTSQTVRNRLRQYNLRPRRPWRAPQRSPQQRVQRYQWARIFENWTLNQWRRVLFTDEVRICLAPDNNRRRVWREPGNEERLHFAVDRVQQHGGSIMFWAGIRHGLRTPLVSIDGVLTAAKYRDDVLIPFVMPLFQQIGENFDNARPHRARIVTQYLEEQNIERIEWPPTSPDMNPIEHAWDQLKRAIWRRPNPPTTLEELRIAVVQEWDNLYQPDLDNLVDSMPRRVRACRLARGGVSRY